MSVKISEPDEWNDPRQEPHDSDGWLSKQQEARQRLILALPYINDAISFAKVQVPDGKIGLAVIITKPDGSGKVTATFNGEELLTDIVSLLGFNDMNELIKSDE
jgi:hypothetical protein